MIKVIIFTKDSKTIPFLPTKDGVEFRHISFNSSKLEDLMVVARHRVLQYPTTIVFDSSGRVILRLSSIVSEPFLEDMINT